MDEIRVPVRDFSVTASVQGEGATVVVLGHGAGGDRSAPLLVRLGEALASSGRRTVLYNFAYSDRGRRLPDPPEVLEMTTRAVGEHARERLGAKRVVHGGKSMGGRIASQVVARGAPADGLVFLGYPLHPPGRPGSLRDRHLPAVAAPMLFVQGTRDAFARCDLLEGLLERLGPKASLHRVEGGDHSFKLGSIRRAKSPPEMMSAGRTAEDVEREIFQAVLGWLNSRGL